MDESLVIFGEIRDHVGSILDVLNDISSKLDKVDGAYSLDEIADAVLDIRLETTSHLQSIDASLSNIDINTN